MKLLFMFLTLGYLLPQHCTTEDSTENDITPEPIEHLKDAHNDIENIRLVEELEFRTSIYSDDVEDIHDADKSDKTSLSHHEDDTGQLTGDDADLSSHDLPHDSNNNPLDWTTLDQGLQDLHNLINQIDEMAPVRTNTSLASEESSEELSGKPKYPCAPRKVGNSSTSTNVTMAQARIVNATELLELVSSKAELTQPSSDNSTNATEGHCVFVMFYAPWCKFSVASAPYFNAVGRAFADIDVIAVDAFQFRSLNARYGTVSVPNFLFFYNNKPVLRYNYSERNFDSFVEFLQNHTGLVANVSVNVSDIDYAGPVPTLISEEPDYALWFSGVFLFIWFMWILKVRYGTVIVTKIDGGVNYIRHIWRTGEYYEQVGDHEHVD